MLSTTEQGAGADICDAALQLWNEGILPVPLKRDGKRPPARFPLSRWLGGDPTDGEIAEVFSRSEVGNLGAALGVPSGGLTVRDFDRAGDYESWRERFPGLAARLPTVRTGRGHHVYCLTTAVEFASHCRPDSSIIVLPERRGEIRRSGYAVCPPSTHPSGQQYRTIVEGDPVYLHDLSVAGLLPPAYQRPYAGPEQPPQPPSISWCAANSIDGLIAASLPSGPGQRHACLFGLVRRLRSHPETRDADPRDLKPIIEQWHRCAYHKIGTKQFKPTWMEFCDGWGRCRHPAGAALSAIAAEAQGERTERLADLCRLLQLRAGDRPFFLDQHSTAAALGVDRSTISRWLSALRGRGRLRLVTPGDRRRHRAAEYQYLEKD